MGLFTSSVQLILSQFPVKPNEIEEKEKKRIKKINANGDRNVRINDRHHYYSQQHPKKSFLCSPE